MKYGWQSLRVQVAVLGFLAIYVPVLLLFGVTSATENDTETTRNGETVSTTTSDDPPWPTWTVVALLPVAAGLAWWLAGRAVRPIERVRRVAEDIEASDLSRRIDLDRGPAEIRSLADSFDAMLARLENAARTQSMLIEDASHELRTPLAVLATNADVLLSHPEPTVELYREGLHRSQSAATRLRTTIDELLVDARGRARTIDRQPADLVALANEVIGDARVLAESKDVQLSVGGSASAECSVDETTVRRAVSNLVDNAIRHAPPGTSVAVEVWTADGQVDVTVADHGPGIPADEQTRVFERYGHGEADTHGTGLGLPIARQVAAAHGGDLTLESPGPDGDGCVFRLRLRR
ncbi:HAMP domain-containing sensor histidine kinase [Solicola gregarius]|uniref:histidine kinase n=1 Tax=Solicola gregarius TaxID=2908642 RepID=A0AA46TLZ6_9ACTN|nr:ATP-binding protein [Solicola gregarius]UYM07578.1 ATP-binding protein [Solicola gregarius]